MNIKTVCYFGIYDPGYNRNRVLMEGLKANGVSVIECNSRRLGIGKYFDLIRKHWRVRGRYDCIIVGFPGYQAAILARFLTAKPVIFDAFFSIYDSKVDDRKVLRKNSLKARYYKLLDRLSCNLADRVLLDTEANIDYFVKDLGIPRKKFVKVLVGADPGMFYPRQGEKREKFLLHFHGHFIPLQGAEYIIRAAHLLKDRPVRFQVIGTGQEYQRVRGLSATLGLNNINWLDNVPYGQLPGYMAGADACLGIFGNTGKARRVIPNKIYEAAAMRKPVISGDSPAIREIFTDREDILLCKMADPEDLAAKIVQLMNDDGLREHVAQGGYETFQEHATPTLIARNLLTGLGTIESTF